MKNAHEFNGILKDLGINPNTLGCLMLDTEKLDIELAGATPYVSPDPDKFWIKGICEDSHVTVRYGFLPQVDVWHIWEVLDEMDIEKPQTLEIYDIDVFYSPIPDEPYECIIGRVRSEALEDINRQLGVLPNINTFPVYSPHITIGYVESGWWQEVGWNQHLDNLAVETRDYSLGKTLR